MTKVKRKLESIAFYTKKEELINALTHWAGVIIGIVGLVLLLVAAARERSPLKITAFAIYGGCFIAMYFSSALYHSLPVNKGKQVLRVFDHASIFLFIAGTYTPIILLSLRGAFRIVMLSAVWTLALVGIVFKICTYGSFNRYGKISLALYLGLGWLSALLIPGILKTTSAYFIIYLVVGGILYSVGTYFYSHGRIPYHHAIWHVFVLGASISHFLGIFEAYLH